MAPEAVLETVLVATQDIAIGEPVTPDVVEEQEVDPEAVQGTPLAEHDRGRGPAGALPDPGRSPGDPARRSASARTPSSTSPRS